MSVSHVIGTNMLPYHHRCWLLNFAPITIWIVCFLFRPEVKTSMISENNLKGGPVRPQHTFPLCISPSQMSSDSAAFLDVVDIMSSVLHGRVFTCICAVTNKSLAIVCLEKLKLLKYLSTQFFTTSLVLACESPFNTGS